MSRTTPVRWWRDDADRYKSRGAYVVPPREKTEMPSWPFELLRDTIDLSPRISAYREEIDRVLAKLLILP